MKIINKKRQSIDFLISKELIDYNTATSFMEKRVIKIKEGKKNEAIWFLEHPSLYTTGRSFETKVDYLESIPIYNTGRGGKMTWHGPGQRIIYFMVNIKKRKQNIRRFVSNLEVFIIKCLKELNIVAFKRKNIIGIWVKDKKKK